MKNKTFFGIMFIFIVFFSLILTSFNFLPGYNRVGTVCADSGSQIDCHTPTLKKTKTPTITVTPSITSTNTSTITPTPTFLEQTRTLTPSITTISTKENPKIYNDYFPIVQKEYDCPQNCVISSINGDLYNTFSSSQDGYTYGLPILPINANVKFDFKRSPDFIILYQNGRPYKVYALDQNNSLIFTTAILPDEEHNVLGAYQDYTLQIQYNYNGKICIIRINLFIDPPNAFTSLPVK